MKKKITLTVALSAIILTSLNCKRNFDPVSFSDSLNLADNSLCYQKNTGSSWQIFLNQSTNEPKNISNNPYNDGYSPIWSPDGRYIAFRYDDPSAKVYLYDIDGDSLINLTPDLAPNESASPRLWTPDGEQIIYYFHVMGSMPITCIMNRNGSNRRILFNWEMNRNYCYFFTDGYHFIHQGSSEEGINDFETIYKSDLDGNSVVILDKNHELAHIIHDFNPYTEEILYKKYSPITDSTSLMLYSINTDTCTTLATIEKGEGSIVTAFFSNDYCKIGFTTNNRIQRGLYKLSVLDISSGQKNLLVTLYSINKEWFDFHKMQFSPYDTYIAFSKNIYQEGFWIYWKSYLYMVDINTKQLFYIDEGVQPQWNPLYSY